MKKESAYIILLTHIDVTSIIAFILTNIFFIPLTPRFLAFK